MCECETNILKHFQHQTKKNKKNNPLRNQSKTSTTKTKQNFKKISHPPKRKMWTQTHNLPPKNVNSNPQPKKTKMWTETHNPPKMWVVDSNPRPPKTKIQTQTHVSVSQNPTLNKKPHSH